MSPFVEVRLSNTANSHVVDLQWNPGKYELFASCTTDGALGLWEVGGQGVNSIAKMPESTGVTASRSNSTLQTSVQVQNIQLQYNVNNIDVYNNLLIRYSLNKI